MSNMFKQPQESSTGSKNKRYNTATSGNVFNNAIKIVCIILAAVLVITLFVFALSYDKIKYKKSSAGQQSNTVLQTDSSIRMEVSLFTEDVPIVGASVIEYMNTDVSVPASQIYSAYKKSGQRLDIGLPVKLSYQVFGLPENISVESATLVLAENPDFANYTTLQFAENETDIEVSLLKTGKKYYYRIDIDLTGDLQSSVSGSFNTLATPRMLYIEGICNVRDIGGWKTVDGKTVKQGLLYRGSELDATVVPEFCATKSGLNDLINVLGIRNDIDLRGDYGKEMYSAEINRTFYSINASYSEVFEEKNEKYLKKLFSDLANSKTYPAYMHCTYGVDRTGTICYLLGAVLGVSEEDLMRDYQLSALYCSDVDNDAINTFIEDLKKYPGNTIQENAENFLLSLGVKATEIASIRNIFLEN